MSDEFKVGDVVVHTGYDGPDPKAGKRTRSGNGPPRKAIVRVSGIVFWQDEIGLIISGYPSNHPTHSWCSLAFKHLPKADDTFINQMRSLKPAKEKTSV